MDQPVEVAWENLEMPRELDYINARIRGSTERLLPEESILSLFSIQSRELWSAALRDTPYSEHLGPVASDPDSRHYYQAVDRSLAQRTQKLKRLADGRPGLALSICLSHWDLSNLLSIISGIHNGYKPIQIVRATVAGGILETDQLEALSHCRTLQQAADLLRLWRFPWHSLVREVVGGNSDRSLPQMRLELSRRWFMNLLEHSVRTRYRSLVSLISERIDQANIMTALMWRTLPSDRDPVEFFLDGGTGLDIKTFRKVLTAPDIREAISSLKPGMLRNLLTVEAARFNGDERISYLDQVLENDLYHRYGRPMGRDPLGIEVMISFLLRLRREGTRIKLSLTRLIYDVPGEVFMEMTGYA